MSLGSGALKQSRHRREVSMATRQAGAANRHRHTETSPVEILT